MACNKNLKKKVLCFFIWSYFFFRSGFCLTRTSNHCIWPLLLLLFDCGMNTKYINIYGPYMHIKLINLSINFYSPHICVLSSLSPPTPMISPWPLPFFRFFSFFLHFSVSSLYFKRKSQMIEIERDSHRIWFLVSRLAMIVGIFICVPRLLLSLGLLLSFFIRGMQLTVVWLAFVLWFFHSNIVKCVRTNKLFLIWYCEHKKKKWYWMRSLGSDYHFAVCVICLCRFHLSILPFQIDCFPFWVLNIGPFNVVGLRLLAIDVLRQSTKL